MSLILSSQRLVLRDFEEADWLAVHAYASQPDVYRFQPWGPSTPDDARAFIARARQQATSKPRTNYSLAIVLAVTHIVIGAGTLSLINPVFRSAELGYFLHPAYWGQGYATETARRLLRFGFDELNVHRIAAHCDPRNAASIRVLERIGMRYEGHLRDTMLIRDGWRDSLVYSMLDHEWHRLSATSGVE